MAENTVVKEQLTSAMVDAGAEVTRKLDELGIPITAALWWFDPESNEWQLLFASPEVASQGRRAVYRKIQEALNQLEDKAAAAPFSSIRLMKPDAEIIRALKALAATGSGVSRIRMSKNAINGHFIEDALIYRNT